MRDKMYPKYLIIFGAVAWMVFIGYAIFSYTTDPDPLWEEVKFDKDGEVTVEYTWHGHEVYLLDGVPIIEVEELEPIKPIEIVPEKE